MPVFHLLRDINKIFPEIGIDIGMPYYLNANVDLSFVEIFKLPFNVMKKPPYIRNIELNEKIGEEILNKIKQNNVIAKEAIALLSLSEFFKSDGIITNNALLIEARYKFYQYNYIRIIPLDEFPDIIDIIAHGNSIFLSTARPLRILPFDIFYQLTHFKNKRFFSWFIKIEQSADRKNLIENLRSALLNRYPYILYSRDMIRFFELQRDYFLRRGEGRFHLMLGYYLSNYYLLLWGMLDHLTIIAKYAYNLSIKEKNCGIYSKEFWNKFNVPNLFNFIRESQLSEWIDIMAEMRHHAAHKGIKVPTELLIETNESKRVMKKY